MACLNRVIRPHPVGFPKRVGRDIVADRDPSQCLVLLHRMHVDKRLSIFVLARRRRHGIPIIRKAPLELAKSIRIAAFLSRQHILLLLRPECS